MGQEIFKTLTVHEFQDEGHVVAKSVLVELSLEVRLKDPYLLVQKLEHHGRIYVGSRHRHEIQVDVSRVQESVAIQLQ